MWYLGEAMGVYWRWCEVYLRSYRQAGYTGNHIGGTISTVAPPLVWISHRPHINSITGLFAILARLATWSLFAPSSICLEQWYFFTLWCIFCIFLVLFKFFRGFQAVYSLDINYYGSHVLSMLSQHCWPFPWKPCLFWPFPSLFGQYENAGQLA